MSQKNIHPPIPTIPLSPLLTQNTFSLLLFPFYLQAAPAPALTGEEFIRFGRPPGSGRILRDRSGVLGGPAIQEGLYQGPGRFHRIDSVEQSRVSEYAVQKKSFIGVGKLQAEGAPVPKIH